jgi:hypothetical protein
MIYGIQSSMILMNFWRFGKMTIAAKNTSDFTFKKAVSIISAGKFTQKHYLLYYYTFASPLKFSLTLMQSLF